MPVPTPFHPRTRSLCSSLRWKDWAGSYAVCSYEDCHELEYFALRNTSGLIDVSPLFKYDVDGERAGELLAYVMTRDVSRLKPGRMTYVCWCDDRGKVLDDGTVGRLDAHSWRVTAAEPALAWLSDHAERFGVTVVDRSEDLAAVAIQGPTARAALGASTDAVERLRFFRVSEARIADRNVRVSRTGYTGDLGYEVWVHRTDALAVWDTLVERGAPHGLRPVGLDALDMTRIEAGFVMNGVDYFSAHHCPIESRKSTPFELGLGWTVDLDRGPFIGRQALVAENEAGSRWALVGLELDWDEYETLFAGVGLPPAVPSAAWRTGVPVMDASGRQVGQATSGTWSPILKRNLALATVEAEHGITGAELRMEVTVEYRRRSVTARVVSTPFFDPPRKRR